MADIVEKPAGLMGIPGFRKAHVVLGLAVPGQCAVLDAGDGDFRHHRLRRRGRRRSRSWRRGRNCRRLRRCRHSTAAGNTRRCSLPVLSGSGVNSFLLCLHSLPGEGSDPGYQECGNEHCRDDTDRPCQDQPDPQDEISPPPDSFQLSERFSPPFHAASVRPFFV